MADVIWEEAEQVITCLHDGIGDVNNESGGELCNQEEMNRRTNWLVETLMTEFGWLKKASKSGVSMKPTLIDNCLWVTFSEGTISKSLRIPLPEVTDNNIQIIRNGDVVRVTSDFWLEREQIRLNYHETIKVILCDDIELIKPSMTSGSPLIRKIVRSFSTGYTSYMVSSTQRLINEMLNNLPLHESDMTSWAMNHRLMIVDEVFEKLRDPADRLEYQVDKNTRYYRDFGWTIYLLWTFVSILHLGCSIIPKGIYTPHLVCMVTSCLEFALNPCKSCWRKECLERVGTWLPLF